MSLRPCCLRPLLRTGNEEVPGQREHLPCPGGEARGEGILLVPLTRYGGIFDPYRISEGSLKDERRMSGGPPSKKGRCLRCFDPQIWEGICVSRPVSIDTCQCASQRRGDDGQGCIHSSCSRKTIQARLAYLCQGLPRPGATARARGARGNSRQRRRALAPSYAAWQLGLYTIFEISCTLTQDIFVSMRVRTGRI